VSSFRAPVERAVATLKTWRILFTNYRRPLNTFKSSAVPQSGFTFQVEFRISLIAATSLWMTTPSAAHCLLTFRRINEPADTCPGELPDERRVIVD
jgi:hypothetical protein